MANEISIVYIDNFTDGRVYPRKVPVGQTIEAFCIGMTLESNEVLVRINRQPVMRDYVLQDGDRVSLNPMKVMA